MFSAIVKEIIMLTNLLSNTSSLVDEASILKEYIDWYNTNPQVTREELYKSYYGAYCYKPWMQKGQLDKYLLRS